VEAVRYESVHIEAISYALPECVVSTQAIEHEIAPLYAKFGMRPGWLESVTGVRERRYWQEGWTPSRAAIHAGRKALHAAGVEARDIDVLISTSVSKDCLEPSIASLVAGALGVHPGCEAFDVGNACLGFLSGMVAAANRIELGQADVALVVAGESSREVGEATLARLKRPDAEIGDFKNELATLTLGSAAVAMVLTSKNVAMTKHRFLGGLFRSATQHSGLCIGHATRMQTDAARLLEAGVTLAVDTWNAVHDQVDLRPAVPGLSQYALHQVGKANHDAVIQALGIPADLALRIYPALGNVGSAGVPLTFALALDQGLVPPGSRVGLMGIGSGLHVAMLGIEW